VAFMDEDLIIIKKILSGDVDSFEVLLRKYSQKVFGIVGRKVPVEDVETVAQDVFLSAFRSLGTYKAKQPFEHWLSRIVRRRCCDYWRDDERRNNVICLGIDEQHSNWLDHALSDLQQHELKRECEKKEAVEVLQIALGKLSAEDREMIESVYFEDIPLKEVAETFEWSVMKAKVRAHRARKKLRIVIEDILNKRC
jgi:RNA polymerase sigma-70 factor, ECF subfamily